MRMINAMLATSLLLSSSVFAADKPLTSTVCVPALRALDEPTTDENLTYPDAFTPEALEFSDDNHPDQVGATAGSIAIILIQVIGEEIGTAILKEIFPNGAMQRLTLKDLENIKKIVREALREDAIRKIDDCVYDIQQTNLKMVGEGFQRDIAIDLLTTTDSMYNKMIRFKHMESKLALLPSAMMLGSLNLGLMQEMHKHGVVNEALFENNRRLMQREASDYLKLALEELNADSWEDMPERIYRKQVDLKKSFWCGDRDDDFRCLTVQSWHWEKLAFEQRDRRCAIDKKRGRYKECGALKKELLGMSSQQFIDELIDVRHAIYGQRTHDDKGVDFWIEKVKVVPLKK